MNWVGGKLSKVKRKTNPKAAEREKIQEYINRRQFENELKRLRQSKNSDSEMDSFEELRNKLNELNAQRKQLEIGSSSDENFSIGQINQELFCGPNFQTATSASTTSESFQSFAQSQHRTMISNIQQLSNSPENIGTNSEQVLDQNPTQRTIINNINVFNMNNQFLANLDENFEDFVVFEPDTTDH